MEEFMIDNLYAAEQVAQVANTAKPAGQPNPIASFLPIILLFVIFYFFLIRPQQKRAKERQAMLNNLQKGDTVITGGGIVGTVVGLKDKMLEIKIAENVNVKASKDSVTKISAVE
jgi:preprotein translocase subunit YajC